MGNADSMKPAFRETFRIEGMEVLVQAGPSELTTTDREQMVWIKVGETRIVFPAEMLKQIVEVLVGQVFSCTTIKFSSSVDRLLSKLKDNRDTVLEVYEAIDDGNLHCKILDHEDTEDPEDGDEYTFINEDFDPQVDQAANDLILLGLGAMAERLGDKIIERTD